jgi:hypothetical protein
MREPPACGRLSAKSDMLSSREGSRSLDSPRLARLSSRRFGP